jgi:isopenicillin-N epimerase
MRSDLGWRLDPAITFLNHGCYGACPTDVMAAHQALRAELELESIRFLTRELPERLEVARDAVGSFLRADPEGLAFVPNATTAINTVLASLSFEPGDELLTDDHEYNAVINAMQRAAARTGARVVVAPIPFPISGPDDVVDALLAAVTPRTRLLVVSHVTSPTALVFPIERLVREFAARGIDTLVDAAHAPGMVPVDVDGLAPAYWTGNGHKWLCGPKGTGFLWVRADRREAIRPLVASHGANEPLAGRSRYRWEADWVGTTDPTGYLTLPAAIDWLARRPGGWNVLMAENHKLLLDGRDRVVRSLRIAAPAPDSMLGSMAAMPVPGIATDGAAAELDASLYDEGIEASVAPWPVRAARARPEDPPRSVLLRVSAAPYNEPADFDRLASVLAARSGTVLAGTATDD